MKRCLVLIILCSFFLLHSSCALPERKRVFWPTPPNKPRLEFLGVYYSQNSFLKTPYENFWTKVLGESPAADFAMPTSIASSADGRVYVADAVLQNVRIFDFNERSVNLLTPTTVLGRPMGLDFVPPNRLYVADSGQTNISVIDVDTGTKIQLIGGPEVFKNPVKVRVNEDLGRIYVSDSGVHKIFVFDMEGNKLFTVGSPGKKDGQFNSPQGIAFDEENHIFVAEQFNARVQVFDQDGNFLYKFGERGDREWQMEMPRDIAVDEDGNVYVSDVMKASVMIFNKQGEYHAYIGVGRRSSTIFGFGNPTGLFIDKDQKIYISDSGARRFAVWQYLTDRYLEEHPIPSEDEMVK